MSECPESRLATIDYGRGFDGPTLRIDVMEPGDLEVLRGTFRSLANRAKSESMIDRRGPIDARWLNVESIRLAVVSKEPRKTVTVRAGARSVAIDWVLDDEGWLAVAELVEGLTGGSGHQYLSRGVDDDALIVLACGEGNPGVFGLESC